MAVECLKSLKKQELLRKGMKRKLPIVINS